MWWDLGGARNKGTFDGGRSGVGVNRGEVSSQKGVGGGKKKRVN